ncbi:hypothetical protein A2473_01825 [candidate division WWE3 bacterium RIFOXYC2_FULL_42_13]|uniref:Uncharacterized protein n=1 Tax=candidate division WWE3 bacterium TaxID=2053526 RepID=A0A3D0ZQL2_UNCKA|nr:MAG: hypothetical protein A2245_02910 [candidate division WWE3 bacterium RIFOXYA2_FULL_43_12]OGC66744.1 MAG: hypothetical protein A2274_01280 [candidate division WWE3 bacterium RIFOXYA12_FULL_43_11]OGC73768.1 MAG: hypothetical protein A2473_01825 [candidate division WWE3 bacterium RIFOXYC2_FULL_42_13]HBY10323.1 hypothetical protein [candidate division WWE3 bacterium]HCC42571.1 hypothetical protein [candidate division WWE3 bacterium]
MAKLRERVDKVVVYVDKHPLHVVVPAIVLILAVIIFVGIPAVGKIANASSEQSVAKGPVVAPSADSQPKIQEPAAKEPVVPVAPAVVEPVAAPQQTRSAEVVTTIRQVGGAEEIIKDWHNEAAVTVKMPVLTSLNLGWGNVHEVDGKPIYFMAFSSDKGTAGYSGVNYEFGTGFVGVIMTDKAESISVTTGWNASDEDVSKRHFNVWSEVYVVNSSMDKDLVAERLVAEWIVDQGKDVGFYVKSDGTVVKMKYDDAVAFNEANPPLFPEQLPQQAEGSTKSVIMTVTQVGSGPIMKDWKNVVAGSVKIPVADTNNWEGILKDAAGKPVYLVLISSDAGTATFEGKEKDFKEGFVAAFITSEPESIVVKTGWNGDNKNFNVWAQKFIVPADEDIDEILKEMLTSYKKNQGKSIGYAILSDGSVFELK